MRRQLLAVAVTAMTAAGTLGGFAHADVATPVVDSGSFGAATRGVAGCFGDRGIPYSFCVLAYDLPGAPHGVDTVRLLAWKWDNSQLAPGPVDSIDVRLPGTALTFGTSATGVAEGTLDASVDDPTFGTIQLQLLQSQPLTTSQSFTNTLASTADGVSPVDDPADVLLPELYTDTPRSAIAPSPCPDDYPISQCLSWDTGQIGGQAVFGTGWFWQDTHASGGWDIIPGQAP